MLENIHQTDSFKKKISIITVNYNNGKGLKRTIESVFSQSFLNYEYIVIDGGSVDGSREIIENYSSKIDYWISEKDKGVYDAMNKGIAKATGEYCYFLNSGDYLWSNDVLERLFTVDFSEDILYGNMIPEGKNRIEHSLKQISFYDFFVGSVYHQAAFIRRKLFDSIGMYDQQYKVVADWEFFLKAIFIHHCTTRYVDIEIACYEIGGLSFMDAKSNLHDRRIILEKYFPRFVTDYDNLNKIKASDLAGIHRAIEHNKVINKILVLLLQISRFIKFNILRKKK
jgi:glycosyltransferase involved in cell wall biosynthesis